MDKKIYYLMLGLFIANMCFAAQSPRNGTADPRIKTIVYNSRDVIVVKGHYGFSTTIEFARYEVIENISIGDSLAWQVSPNKTGNLLFIKPIEDNASTNLVIVTNHRTYNFELTAEEASYVRNDELTFNLRFIYPEDKVKQIEIKNRLQKTEVIPGRKVSAKDWNMEYSFKGSKQVAPIRAFDDGVFTYFKFNQKLNTPAIFLVDAERNESLVNFHVEGEYIVLERIAKQFTIRDGNEVACVFNDKYAEQVLAKSYLNQNDVSNDE